MICKGIRNYIHPILQQMNYKYAQITNKIILNIIGGIQSQMFCCAMEKNSIVRIKMVVRMKQPF